MGGRYGGRNGGSSRGKSDRAAQVRERQKMVKAYCREHMDEQQYQHFIKMSEYLGVPTSKPTQQVCQSRDVMDLWEMFYGKSKTVNKIINKECIDRRTAVGRVFPRKDFHGTSGTVIQTIYESEVMPDLPEQAPNPILEAYRKQIDFSLRDRGISTLFDASFVFADDSADQFGARMRQIEGSIEQSIVEDVTNEILYAAVTQRCQLMGAEALRWNDFETTVKEITTQFGAYQKNRSGHGCDTVEADALSYMIKNHRVTPDTSIQPCGTSLWTKFHDAGRRNYDKAGKLHSDKALPRGTDDGVYSPHYKINRLESHGVKREHNRGLNDNFFSFRTVGEFYPQIDVTRKSVDTCNYKSAFRTIAIWDPSQGWVDMELNETVTHTCAWNQDGSISDMGDDLLRCLRKYDREQNHANSKNTTKRLTAAPPRSRKRGHNGGFKGKGSKSFSVSLGGMDDADDTLDGCLPNDNDNDDLTLGSFYAANGMLEDQVRALNKNNDRYINGCLRKLFMDVTNGLNNDGGDDDSDNDGGDGLGFDWSTDGSRAKTLGSVRVDDSAFTVSKKNKAKLKPSSAGSGGGKSKGSKKKGKTDEGDDDDEDDGGIGKMSLDDDEEADEAAEAEEEEEEEEDEGLSVDEANQMVQVLTALNQLISGASKLGEIKKRLKKHSLNVTSAASQYLCGDKTPSESEAKLLATAGVAISDLKKALKSKHKLKTNDRLREYLQSIGCCCASVSQKALVKTAFKNIHRHIPVEQRKWKASDFFSIPMLLHVVTGLISLDMRCPLGVVIWRPFIVFETGQYVLFKRGEESGVIYATRFVLDFFRASQKRQVGFNVNFSHACVIINTENFVHVGDVYVKAYKRGYSTSFYPTGDADVPDDQSEDSCYATLVPYSWKNKRSIMDRTGFISDCMLQQAGSAPMAEPPGADIYAEHHGLGEATNLFTPAYWLDQVVNQNTLCLRGPHRRNINPDLTNSARDNNSVHGEGHLGQIMNPSIFEAFNGGRGTLEFNSFHPRDQPM